MGDTGGSKHGMYDIKRFLKMFVGRKLQIYLRLLDCTTREKET